MYLYYITAVVYFVSLLLSYIQYNIVYSNRSVHMSAITNILKIKNHKYNMCNRLSFIIAPETTFLPGQYNIMILHCCRLVDVKQYMLISRHNVVVSYENRFYHNFTNTRGAPHYNIIYYMYP